MKFRKVVFENDSILGSVTFDFTDPKGNTVDTIILAGENGCGKSYLLNELFNFTTGITVDKNKGKRRYEIELSEDEVRRLSPMVHSFSLYGRLLSNRILIDHDFTDMDAQKHLLSYVDDSGEEKKVFAGAIPPAPAFFQFVFSDVEINFSAGNIQTVTSKNIDEKSPYSVRSTPNLAQEISQLLVDIDALDNSDLAKWVDEHPGQVPPESVKRVRIKRFSHAFDKMFERKHFLKVDNQNNRKAVLFEEGGKIMTIDQLSSGEKQIVFRGGFLLRNLGTIKGSPILVDEPELSLHPKWQLRILPFLKGLFSDENGEQTSQLIVATHSPFILHNNTRANDKVLVMQKDEKGNVRILDKPEYYSWSQSIAVEEAFNISSILNKYQVIVFLEGETDEAYFRRAIEVFGLDSSKISMNWIGHYAGGDKGKPENTGDKALNNAASFFKANPMMMRSSKVYLLYDCDTNKPDEQEGNLYVGAMTKNSASTHYQIGVENLLNLPEDFNYAKYYKTTTKKDEYGATSTIVDLDKVALMRDIIGLSSADLVVILDNFKTEIETILKRTGLKA